MTHRIKRFPFSLFLHTPEAVLKFRQGVGRLIRSDTGTLTILDSRVRHQWYGRLFLESLDECPVEEVEVPNLGT